MNRGRPAVIPANHLRGRSLARRKPGLRRGLRKEQTGATPELDSLSNLRRASLNTFTFRRHHHRRLRRPHRRHQ